MLALAALALPAGLWLATFGLAGAREPKGIAALWADPLMDLADRSPGLRTGMPQLTKLRFSHFEPVLPAVPQERVLSTVREHVPPPILPPPVLPPALALNAPPEALFPFPVEYFGPGDVSPLRTTDGPPGGTPGLVASVPEWSTWAMMILGLFASGTAIRRRSAARWSAVERTHAHP